MLISVFVMTWLGIGAPFQGSPSPPDLASLIHSLPAEVRLNSPQPGLKLSEVLGKAPLQTVEIDLPALIELTESPDDRTRSIAILSLLGLVLPGEDSNPPVDTKRQSLLLPYVSRLAPRLFDPSTAAPCGLLFNVLSFIRPPSADLSHILLQVLEDPRSTKPLPPPPTPKNELPQSQLYVGANAVSGLLNTGATFYRDPVSNITEGYDTEEVQQAILRFINRPDQTPVSLSWTIQIIARAQPQNPALNDRLLLFLDAEDPAVRMELLRALPHLTFSQPAYASAKAHLAQIVSAPSSSAEFRSTANAILSCWDNNRHHLCH
ncbi:hypothetical protein JAO29_14075 [Edaphobacter sp. HDX4]|uniref:hypothetical protein n=1 Tax=Edaphobacter sp. HDX4 TaxID=2794064 RepID=UPI002FE5408D